MSFPRIHFFSLKLEHTPLIYRSKFWKLINGTGSLHIGVHEDELERLWLSLRLDKNFSADMTFKLKFTTVANQLFTQRVTSTSAVQIEPLHRETAERKELYIKLKENTPTDIRESFFRQFDLITAKKRKQTIVNTIIWINIKYADAAGSMMLTGVADDEKRDWIRMKQGIRVRKAGVETVKACLMCLQRLKKPEKRRLSNTISASRSASLSELRLPRSPRLFVDTHIGMSPNSRK